MTVRETVKVIEKFTIDNSPTIMTVVGITGVAATAYLTGKASFKAAKLLQDDAWQERGNLNFKHDFKDSAKLTWKLYIPPVATGALTIACIVGANRIGSKRAAALAAAYTLSEKAYSEYKDKIVEKLGESKERAARDEIAQTRTDANPVSTREVIITGNGEVLCYDSITGRYFTSNVEKLKSAQNEINSQIHNSMYASLGDFYYLIGLKSTPFCEEMGWNTDKLMELDLSTTMSDDNRPCVVIDYNYTPVRGYARLQ
jgi:hypothetical protein